MIDSVLAMIVPYGSGGHEDNIPIDPGWHAYGRRMGAFSGGEPARNAYGHGPEGREPTEVILLPGECIYAWLGCQSPPVIGNKCQYHHELDEQEDAQALIRRAEEVRQLEAARRARYYAAHREEISKRKRDKYAALRARADEGTTP